MVDFSVECASGGQHSGEVGGIVPETFRVLRHILDKIDDTLTGRVAELFQSPLPDWKLLEAQEVAKS